MNRFLRVFLAAWMLGLCAFTVLAEEQRHGSFIYIPAATTPVEAGGYSLRLEGLTVGEDGRQEIIEGLAGAQFGVYVIAEDGELTPWANPLYPLEPLRLITGEEAVFFSLPSGMDFYLRQESAAPGYLYEDQMIPIREREIVVRNQAEGELLLRAEDSIGASIAGVVFEVVSEAGESRRVETGESGLASLPVRRAETVTVREITLPEGTYPVLSILLGSEPLPEEQAVPVAPAQRTTVTYVHPSVGSVQLQMRFSHVNDKGEVQSLPLPGVSMELEDGIVLTTDAEGQAEASLLEGTYVARFSYTGEADVQLPLAAGQVVIEGGAMTLVELNAAEALGRARFDVQAAAHFQGTVTLKDAEERLYGPYTFDEENRVVTDQLAPGVYSVEVAAPEGLVFQGLAGTEDDAIRIESGQLTQADCRVAAMEEADLALTVSRLGDAGEAELLSLSITGEAELVDAAGETVYATALDGNTAHLLALGGRYRLRLDEETAGLLNVLPESEAFELGVDASVCFRDRRGRLILISGDAEGRALPGAVYAIQDGVERTQAFCDEEGRAVSALLTPGEVRVDTVAAPQGYAEADTLAFTIEAGEALRAEIRHERLGSETLQIRLQSVDAKGNLLTAALSGVRVAIVPEGAPEALTEYAVDDDGVLSVSLAAGSYQAFVTDGLPEGVGAGEALRFTVRDGVDQADELICYTGLGGVRLSVEGGDGSLNGLAYALTDGEDKTYPLQQTDGAFVAVGLTPGHYQLRQTEAPQGYAAMEPMEIAVTGGDVSAVSVRLLPAARLSVSKQGLTFDQSLHTFVVPLVGAYAVYAGQDGRIEPYPNEEEQLVIWSNVSGEDAARPAEVWLPAQESGTAYYLMEDLSAVGFVRDDQMHEVVLYPGQELRETFSVASDRGFFRADTVDPAGTRLIGATYALLDEAGETVITFTQGNEPYTNDAALPVGLYTLRQLSAPAGYALAEPNEMPVAVRSFLSGEESAEATMTCMELPRGNALPGVDTELWFGQEQGVVLAGVDVRGTPMNVVLEAPQLLLELSAEDARRFDIVHVTLSGARDDTDTLYGARIEYKLRNGGWQPSLARTIESLEGPVSLSLAEEKGDVCALRVRFFLAETGEERALPGFVPGELVVGVRVEEAEETLRASAALSGTRLYRSEVEEPLSEAELVAEAAESFLAVGGEQFETESGGKDGQVTGFAFLDADADGLLTAGETQRLAGLTVQLLREDRQVQETARTAADGTYAFTGVPMGRYLLRFEATGVVYTAGRLYSSHVVSGVEDVRYGDTDLFDIDDAHTDVLLLAGCLYAAELDGVMLLSEGETTRGAEGLSLELQRLEGADAEPIVVFTDESGAYRFDGLHPGHYALTFALPEGMLCEDARDGVYRREITLTEGETQAVPAITLVTEAAVEGTIWLDRDASGVRQEGAQGIQDAVVTLLRGEGAAQEVIAETQTDETGRYAFAALLPGTYTVRVELPERYAFTQFSEDSAVFGAASQTGATRAFTLIPGERKQALNIGATIPAKLAVTAFMDTQSDGIFGAAERGLGSVQLTLVRREGDQDGDVLAATTDENGEAVFDGLTPGTYVLTYELPGQWRPTNVKGTGERASEIEASLRRTGRSDPLLLGAGETRTFYMGAALSGGISGTAFDDLNADAIREDNEAAVASILVELLDEQGTSLMETRTDAAGHYSFDGLYGGRYTLRFTAPAGGGFASSRRSLSLGGPRSSRSAVSVSDAIVVTAGQTVSTANIPVVRLAGISGRVFEDANGSFAFEASETGMSGLTVELLNEAGREVLESAVTDASGSYAFLDLIPGSYRLRVALPENYVFPLSGAGYAPMQSLRQGTGLTAAFALAAGQAVSGADYGMLLRGSIAGRIWQDLDYDGFLGEEETGLRGTQVTLVGPDGADAGLVRTDKDGAFAFSDLLPGRYALRVRLPEGYVFTWDGGESLAARSDERTALVDLGELAMGERMEGLLIGALRPATLSGTVWLDENDDGRRQTAEPLVAAAQVRLTILSGVDAGAIRETKTDANGAYRFESVTPGEAELRFTVGEGYAFGKKIEGKMRVSIVEAADEHSAATDALTVVSGANLTDLDAALVGVGVVEGRVWEDVSYDGVMDETETGVIGAKAELIDVTTGEVVRTGYTDEEGRYALDFVHRGTYRLRMTLPENLMFTRNGEAFPETDDVTQTTEPFSLQMGEGLTAMDAGAVRAASIGGRAALHDEGAGISGIQVTLMQGGTALRTVQTDENGTFTLQRLRRGTYRLRFTLPEEWLFGADAWPHFEGSDALEGESAAITLVDGQSVETGVLPLASAARIEGLCWLDADADGLPGTGEVPLTEAVISLLDVDGHLVKTARPDELGHYALTRLREGEYALRFELPEGIYFTEPREEEGASVAFGEAQIAETEDFLMREGALRQGMNIGGVQLASLGDTVWLDENGNGLQDYREPLLPGVTLTLLRLDDDGMEMERQTVISDEFGYYHISGLRPGAYRLLLADDLQATVRFGPGLEEIDSDINPDTGESDIFRLNSGERRMNVDVGLRVAP